MVGKDAVRRAVRFCILRSTIGTTAKLTVRANSLGKPNFTEWEPYNGQAAVRVSPPVRETDSAASLVPSESENARALWGWPNAPLVEAEVSAWFDSKTLDE